MSPHDDEVENWSLSSFLLAVQEIHEIKTAYAPQPQSKTKIPFYKDISQLDLSKITLPFALIQIVLRGENGSLLWLFYFNGKGTSSFYLENSFLPV